MTPPESEQFQQALETIADILYRNTPEVQVEDFAAIELTLRDPWLHNLGPELCGRWSSRCVEASR